MIHINRPSSTRYIARTRAKGCKIWTLSPLGDMVSRDDAIRDMTTQLLNNGHFRGQVLLCAEWYDPLVIAEVKLGAMP